MEYPLVSVVMNCLNGEKYLREAIDSVYAQSYPNWEIVFWDNASSDHSGEIARAFDGRLRYFRGDETIPLGAARNRALREAKGSLIAFLDCDDLWLPEKLEKQVPLFDDPEVGLVYSDTLFFNQAGDEKRLYSDKQPYRGRCFRELLTNYIISLETAMVRREALDDLEYWFDDRFQVIEEFDLFVRIGMDWKIDYVPEVLGKWRVHGESWTWTEGERFVEEKKRMYRSLLLMVAKREPWFADSLQAFARAIACEEAVGCWKSGSGRRARASLRGYLMDGKALQLWLASFFPYAMIASVRSWVRKSVLPCKEVS